MTEFVYRQSSIAEYLTCPRKAQLKYLERREAPTFPTPALGTAAHEGIEFALRHRISYGALPTLESVADATAVFARDIRSEVEFRGAEDERGPFVDRAIALATAYVRDVAPTLDVVDVEHRFATDIDGTLVTGTIDVVERDAVRDTKTSRQAPTPGGSPRHRFQAAVYALAIPEARRATIDHLQWSERTGRATKAMPIPERTRTVRHLPVVIDGDALDAERTLATETIRYVREQVDHGDFPRNPTACVSYGRTCEFTNVCMPWRSTRFEQDSAQNNGEAS